MCFQSEVIEIDETLQSSAASVMVKAEELVQARKVENNIASAIDNLTLCLPVLTTYAKLQKQMNEKRFGQIHVLYIDLDLYMQVLYPQFVQDA